MRVCVCVCVCVCACVCACVCVCVRACIFARTPGLGYSCPLTRLFVPAIGCGYVIRSALRCTGAYADRPPPVRLRRRRPAACSAQLRRIRRQTRGAARCSAKKHVATQRSTLQRKEARCNATQHSTLHPSAARRSKRSGTVQHARFRSLVPWGAKSRKSGCNQGTPQVVARSPPGTLSVTD